MILTQNLARDDLTKINQINHHLTLDRTITSQDLIQLLSEHIEVNPTDFARVDRWAQIGQRVEQQFNSPFLNPTKAQLYYDADPQRIYQEGKLIQPLTYQNLQQRLAQSQHPIF